MSATLIIAFILATAIPIAFLYVIYTRDLYRTGAFHLVLLCFLWGIIVVQVAKLANESMQAYGLVDYETFRRFSAPIVEEVLKGLILIYLVRRPNFTYFVDGAIYGFAAGIGFAIFENYLFIIEWGPSAIVRVISTNLMHASGSGLIGIAVGLARFERSYRKILVLLAGTLLAMSLHVGFNNLVTRASGLFRLVYGIVVGLAGAGGIYAAIRRGLNEEKKWIEETLGEADRVTAGEAAVVHRLEDAQKILAPLAKKFGSEKASQIERFLLLQARLGILRKTLEKLDDAKMLKNIEGQMDTIRQEMDESRRAVGAYCMLYLRNIFPEEASPLWGRLETIIQERIASRPATAGPSLWSTLEKRTATQVEPTGGSEPSAPGA